LPNREKAGNEAGIALVLAKDRPPLNAQRSTMF